MRRIKPPTTPGALVATLAVLAVALLIVFGLRSGGLGMAHFIGGTTISAVSGFVGMLGRGR